MAGCDSLYSACYDVFDFGSARRSGQIVLLSIMALSGMLI